MYMANELVGLFDFILVRIWLDTQRIIQLRFRNHLGRSLSKENEFFRETRRKALSKKLRYASPFNRLTWMEARDRIGVTTLSQGS